MLTLHAPITEPVPARDAVIDVKAELNRIDTAINADGLPCNVDGLWTALLAPENKRLKGHALVLVAALASLEKISGQGVRVSRVRLARRAATIQELLNLASQVGWQKIHEALNATE